MPSAALVAALALMCSQDGLAHVTQLRAEGLSRRELSSRLDSGSWVEAPAGVIRSAGAPATDRQRLRAAYLAVRFGRQGERRVAVTGSDAAVLYQLPLPPGFERDGSQLVVPKAVTRVPVPVRRVNNWSQRRFAQVEGFNTAVPADAVLDLATEIPRDDLFAPVQEVIFRRPAAATRLRCLCRQGMPGSGSVASILDALDQGIDSVLHEHGHGHLRVVRLPAPRCGLSVLEGMGACDCVITRPGATSPPWGLIVGWDGETHRLKKRKYRHDRVRDRAARRQGYGFNHYGWDDHEHPADMYADLTETWSRILSGSL